MSFWPWPNKRVVYRQLSQLWEQIATETEATTRALLALEKHMSATDDLVTRLGAATDEIASDLADLRDEVSGGDAAIAAKFEPLVSRLEALGADPANPVPDPEPQPEPVDEPPADEPA